MLAASVARSRSGLARGDHGMARFEQRVDDAVPARRLGERAVDENDRRFHETLLWVARFVCPAAGLAEPVLEAGRGDAWVVAGGEGVLVELCAEVARVDVGLTRRASLLALRTRRASSSRRNCSGPASSTMPFTGALDRDVGQGGGDVVGRLGLNEHGRQMNRLALGARVGDAADELEELRRAEDRVRDGRGLDRLFLGELRTEVAAVLEPVGADDGERDVVARPRRPSPRRGCCATRSGRSPSPPRRPRRARSTRRRRPGRPRAPRPAPRR